MPASQGEWEAHWAFYKLTVAQRDAAWAELEDMSRMIRQLDHLMRSDDA